MEAMEREIPELEISRDSDRKRARGAAPEIRGEPAVACFSRRTRERNREERERVKRENSNSNMYKQIESN